MNEYPELEALIGGWFHQDYDLEGDTVPEIIASYARTLSAARLDAVIVEIDHFLATHGEAVDQAFDDIFAPDIDPAEFSGSTRAFLLEIRSQLAPPDA